MGTLFVNKSGRAFKITRTNGGSDVIGTLPVNAIFAWTGHPRPGGCADHWL